MNLENRTTNLRKERGREAKERRCRHGKEVQALQTKKKLQYNFKQGTLHENN
jgi:hypothetical protein